LKQTKGMRHGRSHQGAYGKRRVASCRSYSFAHAKIKNLTIANFGILKSMLALVTWYVLFKIDWCTYKKNISLIERFFSDFAEHHPKTFAKVVEAISKNL